MFSLAFDIFNIFLLKMNNTEVKERESSTIFLNFIDLIESLVKGKKTDKQRIRQKQTNSQADREGEKSFYT